MCDLFNSGQTQYIFVVFCSLRVWYNGSTKASQALDEGSIPFARTKNRIDLVSIVFLDCGDRSEPGKEGSKTSRFWKR